MKDKQKVYEEKLDAQLLEERSEQIALLKARSKLYELRTVVNETWEDLTTDAKKAWDEVKVAFHSAVSKFQ